MTGRPVLQSQFEKSMWRSLNGGGPLGRFAVTNGGPQAALEKVASYNGTLNPGLLVSLMGHLDEEGKATAEALREMVSRSRAIDCTPSVRASEILLANGDTAEAEELLRRSDRSQEVLHRSVAEARIRMKEGDREGARAAALRAHDADCSCEEPYSILAETDPGAGWPQMLNIQKVFEGEAPVNPPGEGRVQELYTIYYEWFRGSRETASAMLARSSYYASGDRDFLIASARMSVDEGDWHSARMMYSRLREGAPPYLLREMAEACLDAGDAARALSLLSECDQTSPRTMLDTVRARHLAGDDAEAMVAMRAYLDSEWAGSDEYLGAVRMLIGFGMDRQASEILTRYMDCCGKDTDSLILKSALSERAGDCMSALMYSTDATMRDKKSVPARVQTARVYMAMGDHLKAEKECSRILSESSDNPDALGLMVTIKAEKGEQDAVIDGCRRLLDIDPADVDALVHMCRAQTIKGDAVEASDAARRAVRADGSRETYLRALSALMAAGPSREADYLLREAEKRFPRDPAMKRARGNMEYAEGEYLKASATFAQAAGEAPDDPMAWYSKGMADEARGDTVSAEDAYDRAIALDPDIPEFWIGKAAARERAGDVAGAVRALDRASELDRGDLYPVIRKAAVLESAGSPAEALRTLGVANAMSPGDTRVTEWMSRLRDEVAAESRAGPEPEPAPAVYEAIEEPVPVPEPVPAVQNTPEEHPAETDDVSDEDAPVIIHAPEPDEPVVDETPEPVQEETAEPTEVHDETPEGPVPEPESVPVVQPEEQPAEPDRREDIDSMYSIAFSLEEAGDHRGAMRAVDKALEIDLDNVDLLKLKARISLGAGDHAAAERISRDLLTRVSDDPEVHETLGRALLAQNHPETAIHELEKAVSLGADDADVHAARGEAFEAMGATDRASECYSAAVSRDPGRLDLAEKLARMMYSRREVIAADGMLNRILRRDPRRMSAILLKAEIAHARKDDKALMAAYDYFVKCPNPGPENTVRMVRMLEDMGHSAEAKDLVVGRPQKDVADNSVKRYAEKALRRAYAMKVSPTDPDLMSALGLDGETAAEVTAYLGEQPDYGPINPGSDRFREMEALSRDAVMKLDWRDLEHNPRLPLERVYVQCACRDSDSAKEIVAYIFRAMLGDPGRNADPRLSDMSMRLPKGLTVYEVMRECDLGVYEARIVQNMIV